MTYSKTSDLRGQDIIDSRDITARIEDLEDTVESMFEEWLVYHNEDKAEGETPDEDTPEMRKLFDEENKDESEVEELRALKAFADEVEDYVSDWRHGESFIADSYFEQYAQQLAEDIGALDNCNRWPATCIDWERAADELKSDYSSVEFDGTTYWYRG